MHTLLRQYVVTYAYDSTGAKTAQTMAYTAEDAITQVRVRGPKDTRAIDVEPWERRLHGEWVGR